MTGHPLVLVPQHFGSLLFDRRSSRYYPFDHEATSVLDGLIDQTVHELLPAHPDPSAVCDLLDALDPLAVLTPDQRLSAVRLEADPPEDHLLGPLATHVEVAGACNLTCTHCFAAPLPRRGTPLTLAELDDLFGQLAAVGSFRLGLTGGEPLLRRDILDIIDAATDAGLHPCLTTNGFYLTESLARALTERPLVWLNISLDGANATTNDAIRGEGSFDTVVGRLRELRGLLRFTLAFTVTRDNVHELQEAAALAEDLGASTAVFRPLYPTGAALDRTDLMPQFGDYQRALKELGQSPDTTLRGLDPFSPQARHRSAGRVHAGHGCGAATTVCSVSVDGRVNPCSFLGPEQDAGSVRERSFRELWDAGHSFVSLRDERGEEFNGGCRARARAMNGSMRARDPWEAEWRASDHFEAPHRTLEVLSDR